MSRLWPRSVAGQLVAVILLALLLALGAAFLIFADERRVALEVQQRNQVLGRAISAVELLAALPAEHEPRLLRAAGTAQLRLTLDATPLVDPATRGSRPNRLERYLVDRLDGLARDVLVRRETVTPALWRPWREHDVGEEEASQRRGGGAARMRWDGLAISIELNDGRWLNARGVTPPPPAGPARSALLAMLVMGTLVTFGTVIVVRRLTAPLRELALAAERLGRGEAVRPLPETGPAEVRRSTAAFNLMQERLRRFVDDRTRMLAAISHDLRTPITTLRLRAELLDDDEASTRILATLDEMQRMVEATLAFAHEEASSESTRTVDLAALVESVVADLVDLGAEARFEPAGRLTYRCRPTALTRAVRNLVENALRYGHRARVRLGRDAAGVVIEVDDDGPGIPDADLERVFAPFVRLEASRSPETGGIGLGLAIARTIARAHGGDVTLANRAGGGLSATLHLPAQHSG
jgi:signal transduction histidine kinase